jgi:hypothetical protein
MDITRVVALACTTQAEYLSTSPSTHNINAFSPAQLTLVTQKKPQRTAPFDSQQPSIASGQNCGYCSWTTYSTNGDWQTGNSRLKAYAGHCL